MLRSWSGLYVGTTGAARRCTKHAHQCTAALLASLQRWDLRGTNVDIPRPNSACCAHGTLGRLNSRQQAPRPTCCVLQATRRFCTKFWQIYCFRVMPHRHNHTTAISAAQRRAEERLRQAQGIESAHTIPSQHAILGTSNPRSRASRIDSSSTVASERTRRGF